MTRSLVVGILLVATGCSAPSYATDGAAAPQAMPAGDVMAAGGFGAATRRTVSEREEAGESTAALDKDAPATSDLPFRSPMPEKQAPAQQAQTGTSQTAPGSGNEALQNKRAPILIYTADFTMSVFEVKKSLDAVESIAKDAGGYLSRRDDQSITVRIPAGKFQDVVTSIEKVGDVLHRNVVSEDVTAEYRDLEVQLQNLLALRSRFEKLLEKAAKVEEALSIERELGRITGEIERIKGRLKLLTDLAQYSTITVSFQPRSNSEVHEGPFVLPLPWVNDVGLRRLMSL
jgi:hypothetical protein